MTEERASGVIRFKALHTTLKEFVFMQRKMQEEERLFQSIREREAKRIDNIVNSCCRRLGGTEMCLLQNSACYSIALTWNLHTELHVLPWSLTHIKCLNVDKNEENEIVLYKLYEFTCRRGSDNERREMGRRGRKEGQGRGT